MSNDRKTDVIISGGENIDPAERVPRDIPGVAEAAVVVRAAGSDLAAGAIMARFEQALAHFKHPKGIVFTKALPRNVMGKAQKFELREIVTL